LIRFDARVCGDFAQAASREWLETNGLGGFASSTIIGCNTRRYHGLLVATLKPPAGRTLLLSRLEEEVIVDGLSYPLSTNQFSGAVHPLGHRFQEEFRLEPFPTFRYRVGGVVIEKEVFVPQGLNAAVIIYRLFGEAEVVELRLRPLAAGRDFHHLNHPGNTQIESEARENELLVRFGWGAQLHIYHNGATFSPEPQWFHNFEYAREKERGLDAHEDLYSPGILGFNLSGGECRLVASAEPVSPQAGEWREEELSRRLARQNIWPEEREEIRLLVRSADSFLVRRSRGLWGIIAGYHWFEDWGRDAMISLPGLCLATGNFEPARGILLAYARACKDGLLPNRFVEADGHPEYNTVDAALWFVNAAHHLAGCEGQQEFVRENLLPVAQHIVEHYAAGTHFGIHADSDGLLEIGEEGSQLTWMDAKVGEQVITPRAGKPVEIQALWYNALRILEEFGDDRWKEIAEKAKLSFASLFWNEQEGCLYDRLTRNGPDASIRPNQVFALSLAYPILSEEKCLRMMEVVERELLTPYGLRTLSPRDSRYCGRYEGDVFSRDSAYHQGTVWPWLMGPFVSAYLRLHGNSPEATAHCRRLLEPLLQHLSEAGLGSISEIFDGDPPHAPRGCISQAWSVAEVLRAWALLSPA